MPDKKPGVIVPDLNGRRALVTGASDGLGLEITRRLAQAGAEVVMPVRNPSKGAAAERKILDAWPRARLSVRELDLASMTSVTQLGSELMAEGRPFDIWINNAAVMVPPKRVETEDGFELQFATNFLGHFALVGQVLPLLKAGRARVTTMSSVGSRNGEINFDDLQSKRHYRPWPAYHQSKLALTLFARELDRRSDRNGWGITSNVAHPGFTTTNLQSAGSNMGRRSPSPMSWAFPRIARWFPWLIQQVGTGALPALYAATCPEAGGDTMYGPGGFFHLTGAPKIQKFYRSTENPRVAERIWQTAEDLTGTTFA
jgi:NAD(P)-dependent dehydrogenase (short-subunit alcohol dehydrogenase family)